MAALKKDPTEPIRKKASEFPNVDKGTACTQSSFKANKKGFLYIGTQGGRYKAMFKLDKSIPEATKLAAKSPDEYEVGKGGWVVARFTAEKPIPKKTWEKWLTESYELTGATKTKSTAKKKTTKK
ncbi:MAG TPA: MmcQ/YjbR family DNA-binding protein [Phycisphaerae bacterium]|nr:MmcQ/YjbR family DNA-binding protein [Phycisphaerae bacterium]